MRADRASAPDAKMARRRASRDLALTEPRVDVSIDIYPEMLATVDTHDRHWLDGGCVVCASRPVPV
jgi:hypothetical protein